MSDQNLEYTLDVDIAAAERKLKSLFGDMETSMDILGKAVGKKLKGALTEQEQSAREFGRQLTALDRAVQSNFGLVEKLTDKYVGLGNTKLNGLIGQLEQLTKSSISPELQKLMDNRAATPAGALKADTGSIRQQIDAEIAAIANRKAMEKQEAADFIQLQKQKQQATSQRLKEEMDAEVAATKNRRAQELQQAADFVETQKLKRQSASEAIKAIMDAEAAARANRKAAEQQEAADFVAAQKLKREAETQRLRESADSAATAAANRKAQDEALAKMFVEEQRIKRERESQRLKQSADRSAEQKLLQDRIRDARSLAVETGKANAEKFGSDQVYRQRVGAIYAQLNSEYDKLMTDSVTMTAEAVSAKIQLIEKQATTEKMIAVNAAQDRAIATAKANASLGRFSSNLYMVQQTVEDFSYAGLRGATNNLAFMASTIAGPAGTAAMVGMLGLQFAYSTGMLEKLDKELGISATLHKTLGILTQEQIDRNKKEAESWSALYDARMQTAEALATTSILDIDSAGNEKTITDKKKILELKNQELLKLQQLKSAYDGYNAAKLSRVDQALIGLGSTDEANQFGNKQNTQAEALKARAMRIGNALGIAIDPQGMEEASKKADDLSRQIAILNEELIRLDALNEKLRSFGDSFDQYKQGLEGLGLSSTQTDTTGMTSKGADIFRDYLDRVSQTIEKNREEMGRWVDKNQDMPGVLDQANKALKESAETIDKQTESLQKNLKFQGEVVSAIDKEINSYEKYIFSLERAIEKESEHRDSLASQRSVFEDNTVKRQMSALDRIDDLKAGEQKDKLQSQFGSAQDQLQWMKRRDEEIAQQMAQGMGKGGSKWLSNVGNQIDAYYEMLGQKNKNFLTQEMERADQIANANKQKRLDDLKQQLGGKAQDLTAEAKQAMEGGNLDTASAKLKQAMKTMEELQQAQEKAIGKSSSKQAEQIEKDLKGSSDKIRQLFDMMDEVSQKNTEKLQGDQQRALDFMKELEMRKHAAEAIDPYAPTAFDQLEEIMERIKAIGVEKMRVAAIPMQISGGLAMGGGGGFGGGSTINSTINMNMGGSATPTAALAAANAAAASFAMQRA